MIDDLAWALAAALILTLLGVVLKKPRRLLVARARSQVRRAYRKLFLVDRLERTERGMERIAAELAQRRYNQDGNPDDELYQDWYRWFTGDPDANVDYSRKQQRDIERLKRGDFSHRRPNGLWAPGRPRASRRRLD
jgi:hypothetical protein